MIRLRLLFAILLLVCCQTVLMGADMKIAILRDSFPTKPCFADPAKLAGVLSQSNNAVEFVTADQLADARAFNADRYWLVVLPYGSYFPAAARDNFLAYLRAGGSFLSTGGYAFDEPVVNWKGQWLTRGQALIEIPTREVRIGAEGDDDYLTGEWNGREIAPGEWKDPDGTKRWSGKDSGLRLGVDPSRHYTIEIQVSENEFAARSRWRLMVNGKPSMDIPAGSGQTSTLKLGPEQFAGKRELDIRFDGKLWRPSDLTDSPDDRLLGLAVGRVRLISDGPVEQGPDLSVLSKPINMRHGVPADFLQWEPEQLGVFDAGYRLTGGKSISPAGSQCIIPNGRNPGHPDTFGSFRYEGDIDGWAAAGTTGSQWYWTMQTHRSRLIPLLDTKDEFGRYRGSAGSLMVNTLEPYRGSIWAYFGVENREIFSLSGADKMLVGVVSAMKRGVFVHDLHPSYACYRQGEEAVIKGSVSNFGRQPVKCDAQIDIADESGSPVHAETIQLDLAPGETREISTKWHPGVFASDLYTARADLVIDGKPIDTLKAGFYTWHDQTVRSGMQLSYRDDYLRDAGRPRYMLGVEAFYDRYCPMGMDPLDIERDFRDMADMGIHIARTFTYSDTEEDWRFRDALVMASARHHVAFWLSGTVTMGGYLNDPTTISLPQSIGERYKGVPGVFIDLFNEPDFHAGDDPQRDQRFNDYLRAKYGSTEALRVAWGDELGKDEQLGSLKMGWLNDNWTSVRCRDIYQFLVQQGSKWVTDVTGAIKSKDPSRLVSCGYLAVVEGDDDGCGGYLRRAGLCRPALLPQDRRHTRGSIRSLRSPTGATAARLHRSANSAPRLIRRSRKPAITMTQLNSRSCGICTSATTPSRSAAYLRATGIWRDPQSCIFPYGIVYLGLHSEAGRPKLTAR